MALGTGVGMNCGSVWGGIVGSRTITRVASSPRSGGIGSYGGILTTATTRGIDVQTPTNSGCTRFDGRILRQRRLEIDG